MTTIEQDILTEAEPKKTPTDFQKTPVVGFINDTYVRHTNIIEQHPDIPNPYSGLGFKHIPN